MAIRIPFPRLVDLLQLEFSANEVKQTKQKVDNRLLKSSPLMPRIQDVKNETLWAR